MGNILPTIHAVFLPMFSPYRRLQKARKKRSGKPPTWAFCFLIVRRTLPSCFAFTGICFIFFANIHLERCRSGLTGTPGKRVCPKGYREFESLPFRSRGRTSPLPPVLPPENSTPRCGTPSQPEFASRAFFA